MQPANPQIVEYIQTHLNNGHSADSIRQILLHYGWPSDQVDAAFAAVDAAATVNHQVYPEPIQSSYSTAAQPTTTYPQTNAPTKYKVFRAIKDAFEAIEANPQTFVITTVAGYAVAFVLLLIKNKIQGSLSLSMYGSSFFFLLFLIVLAIWNALTNVVTYSFASMAIADGAQNKKSSISEVFQYVAPLIPRLVLTSLLYTIVVLWPIGLIIFSSFFLLSAGMASMVIVPIILVASMVWILIAMLRLALVEYVALFEPELPLHSVFKRSSYLLRKGGQWFIVKGLLLLLAFAIVISLITGMNIQTVTTTTNTVLVVIIMLADVVINSVMVMLYQNRVQVRGTDL